MGKHVAFLVRADINLIQEKPHDLLTGPIKKLKMKLFGYEKLIFYFI